MLARQVLYYLSHAPSLCAWDIFEIGSHFMPRPAWTKILPPIYISLIAGMKGMYNHAQPSLVEMGSHKPFAWSGLIP
jgi:hypothetical protein